MRSMNICTAGEKTWYFFQIRYPAFFLCGMSGRMQSRLSPVVLISLSKQMA